jgi:hypothetical protein
MSCPKTRDCPSHRNGFSVTVRIRVTVGSGVLGGGAGAGTLVGAGVWGPGPGVGAEEVLTAAVGAGVGPFRPDPPVGDCDPLSLRLGLVEAVELTVPLEAEVVTPGGAGFPGGEGVDVAEV